MTAAGDRFKGFTLVEMLVAVTLIMLLMWMFAEIFRLASDAMSAQRGLAENAQRARSVAIVIRSDLDKRTFRNVVPFFPGEQADTSPTTFSDRKGYLYISENDPNDDTDDVLQFTVDAGITSTNRDDTPYYGRATLLAPEDPSNPGSPLAPNLIKDFNQPEADDGQVAADGTSASPTAEICYFLRNGNLYRRVLLIRKPLPLAGANPQPTDRYGNDLFANSQYYFVDRGNGPTRSRAFWLDFDCSAHYAGKAVFHGTADLDNSGAGGAFPLANPAFRFGHNHADGQPREYVGDPTAPLFIGRFTHQETSFAEDLNGNGQLDPGEDLNGNGQLDEPFAYPHWIRSTGNPMDFATSLFLADGVVAERRGAANVAFTGLRRSEDILMSNVVSFDINVWDDLVGAFVDIGHSLTEDRNGNGRLDPGEDRNGNGRIDPGDFNQARNWLLAAGVTYGPWPRDPTKNRIFDTWHPRLNFDRNVRTGVLPGIGGYEPPPFRPMRYYPADSPVPSPIVPLGFRGHWQPGRQYRTEDRNGNGRLDPGEDMNGNGRLDADVVFPRYPYVRSKVPFYPFGAVFAYECVASGRSGATEPRWPGAEGHTVQDGTVVWRAVRNLKRLRAIQITIRFYDVSSEQLRQMTLVHSLVD